MKTKPRTLIERLGFLDQDRRGYSHDEIQIWAYRNFESIVRNVFPLLKIDNSRPLDLKLEYPVSTNDFKNYIVGFIDVYSKQYNIGIEVKAQIPIVGDLLRQIQFYRRYLEGSWIIVSPDDRNKVILREQGIQFYKYCQQPPEQLALFQHV